MRDVVLLVPSYIDIKTVFFDLGIVRILAEIFNFLNEDKEGFLMLLSLFLLSNATFRTGRVFAIQ